MRRPLLPTAAFTRAARRLARRNPRILAELPAVLHQLEADAFAPSLRSHKLKGKLGHCWACSVGYDLRIVFRFVQRPEGEAIVLLSLGTHDEVY